MLPLETAQNRIAAGIGDAADHAIVAAASVPEPTNAGALPDDWFGDEIDLMTAYTTPAPPRDDVLIGAASPDVILIGAPGGSSKSFLVANLVHDLALGGSAASVATTLVPVGKLQSSLVLTAEESLADVHGRMHDIGTRLSAEQREQAAKQIKLRSMRRSVPVLIDRDGTVNQKVADLLERHACGRRNVVLDPLTRFVRADKNDEGIMVLLVTTLEEIAQRIGCTFMLVHHAGKAAVLAGNGDSALALKGSVALVDSCRMAIMVYRPPKKVAAERQIDARQYRVVKIDKANHRADKDEIWFGVRNDGTLEYDAYQTDLKDANAAIAQSRPRSARRLRVVTTLAKESVTPQIEVEDEEAYF